MTYTLVPPLPKTPTPEDYHRVHFDPANLPSKRIVGLLACQRDPLLRKLTTRVISARPAQISEPPAAKGREKKKKKDPIVSADAPSGSSTPNKGTLWEVEVEDTVIFPEGGGQAFDTGIIRLGDEEGELVVEGCLRRKLDSVHLVRVPVGRELDGIVGKEVELEVDWERRMDHMSIHTAQHLLSAILDTYAEGLNTLSWGFAPHPSLETPYVELPRAMTWSEVEEVEKKCNEAIERGVRIWVDVGEQEEGFVKTTAGGVRENRGIPEDYKDGVIRYINIEGIDKNACCGTQLPHLGHLSFLHIIPPSTPSASTKPTQTPTRLFFVSGPRAVRYLQHTSRQVSLAAQTLLVGRNDLVERVEKMDILRKETSARERELRSELAKVLGQAIKPENGVVYYKRTDKSTHDFEFIGSIASSIADAKLSILVSAPIGSGQSLMIVTGADHDFAKDVNEKIKVALNGIKMEGTDAKGPRYKGGGAKGRYMGKLDGKWGKEEDEAVEKITADLQSRT